MERLTDRTRAQKIKENADKLRAAGVAVETAHAEYIRLSAYEDAEQTIIDDIKHRQEIIGKNTIPTAYDIGIIRGLRYALFYLKQARYDYEIEREGGDDE